jgi:hypothetical protein
VTFIDDLVSIRDNAPRFIIEMASVAPSVVPFAVKPQPSLGVIEE